MHPNLHPTRPAALAALALGTVLVIAPAAGAEGWPRHPARDHAERDRSDEPVSAIRVAGSGAVAAVQVCDGETQVATIAGGNDAFGILNSVGGGCADRDDANGALAVGGTGAVAAATEGAAVTLPAGGVAALPAIAAQVASEADAGHGGMGAPATAKRSGVDASAGQGGRSARAVRAPRAGGGGRAGRIQRVARGDREGRGGRRARVDRMPAAGIGPIGAPIDIAAVVAAAMASVASAGIGFGTRRR